MADYFSTQDGDWNDPATWGGGGYPSVAGDAATISHTVTYNVSSATALGQVVIASGGILTFSTTASTKLTLGHEDLIIQTGGELRVGTSGTPIPDGYTVELVWATTADNEKGINRANGSIVNFYGDPTHYGSNDTSSLAANWTSGSTFTIVGDFTTKWKVGQTLTIHKGTNYANYNTDVFLGTITGLALNGSNTDVTISQAHPGGTFYATGKVTNVTRNIKLYKSGANGAVGQYNTNRPRILDNGGLASIGCVFDNVQITGFRSIQTTYNFNFTNSVFRNGYACIEANGSVNIITSGRVFSSFYGVTGTAFACTTSGLDIFGCYNAVNGFYETAPDGNFYANYMGFYNATLNFITGNVFSNYIGLSGGTGILITGHLSYDGGGNLKRNTVDIWSLTGYFTEIKMRGALMPSDVVIGNRNSLTTKISVSSENHLRVLGAHKRWKQYGDIVKNTTVVRSGGADNSIEFVPLSYCAGATPLSIMGWEEHNVPVAKQTRSIYIKGEGWTSFPTAPKLYLSAEYISDAVTLATTEIKSTQVLMDNTTWTKFSVTFTPAVAGTVRFMARLSAYEAGAKGYIDSQFYKT